MTRKLLIAAIVFLGIVVAGGLLARWLVNAEAIRAAVERQATEALGQPVTVDHVDWAVSARPRVVLTGVKVGSPAAITVSRVELTTGLRALLSKRVEHGSVSISGSRIVLPLSINLAGSGPAAARPGSPAPEGNTTSAFTIASIDRISLSEIDLVAAGRQVRFDMQSSLVGDRLTVSGFRMKSGETSVQGKGEFSSLSARRGVFSATADALDLDELLALASGLSGHDDGEKQTAASTRTAPMDVRVELEAARGRLVGIPFTNFATTLTLGREETRLDPLRARVFDGTLAGRLRVDASSDPRRQSQSIAPAPPRVSLSATMAGFDVAQLAALAGQAGVLTGRLAGEMQLHAEAGAADVVFRTVAGTASVVVTNGTAPYLDLVGPVILAFGRPDPSSPAQRSKEFSRLSGTLVLADGVLRSNDLAMASRDVDLRGQGTLRLPGGAVDVNADLVLSEALSAQAGRDLIRYASEGSRVVLPATITGTLAAPTVSIDLGAALQRAARNALSDRVRKELGRIFKR